MLAFPGAEGFGAHTVGGRNFVSSSCYIVNTLDDNDDAPVLQDNRTYTSSFRAACHASGPRFVVFAKGGTCTLTLKDRPNMAVPNININNPYITILGGTAPGGGFCVNGAVYIIEDEVICTHLRFRGDNSWQAGNSVNSWSTIACDNVIVDHCTSAWTSDNSPELAEATSVTYSNNLIGPPVNVNGQSRGPLIYGDKFSFIRNIIYNCVDRQPSVGKAASGCEILYNSVVDHVSTNRTWIFPTYAPIKANVQGNSYYYFEGTDEVYPDPGNSAWDSTKPIRTVGTAHSTNSSIYVEDNFDEYWRPLGTEDEDANVYVDGTSPTFLGSALDFTGNSNYAQPTATTAADAHAANIHATTGVGAWRVRDADANFAVARDTADTIIINNCTFDPTRGLFHPLATPVVDAIEDHVNPYPVLASGTPLGSAYDGHLTNGGIPDSYTLPPGEKWFDQHNSGYCYLEVYAHGIARDWDSTPVNVPTNIFINAFPVTPGTYTVLTGLSVFDGDSDIATVTFTSVGNTASLQLSDDSGVDLDI